MTSPSDLLNTYIPVYDLIPEKWEEARVFLVETLRVMSNGINDRDVGLYLDLEQLNGQQFIPGTVHPQEFRSIFRKVIDLSGLPDFGSVAPNSDPKNVAHSITTNANTIITRLYGVATDPGASAITLAIPLPYVDMTGAAANIDLSMDATNIIIKGDGATDYSAFTTAYVVVEYVQEE